MPKLHKVKGSTSMILELFIQDSSSTTGAGLTGLAFNTASLTCYYHRNTAAAPVAVTLVTMTVGTFTSSGFKEVDATNMPGVYQLCLPDAAFVTGADSVVALLKGATNMAPITLEIQLTGVDFSNATNMGLTNLDAALSTRASQTSLDVVDDFLDTEVAAIKAKTDNLPASPASEATLSTIAGYIDTEVAGILAAVDTEVAAIKAKTDLIPAAPAAVGDIPTANANADALLDRANAIEAGATPRQSLRLMLAALAGKLSGAATATVTIRNAVADSKDRIVATVDADGNRTAVTTDVS